MSPSVPSTIDILIIGAGIAGINAGYRIQTQHPNFTSIILERRDNIGGTWSFFKYPGIRSDSDLFTFGFGWEPWHQTSPIADADSIVSYVRNAAKKHGVDRQVRFGWEVTEMDWRSEEQCWNVKVKKHVGDGSGSEGEERLVKARYVIASTGFFNYREALAAKIPGIEDFAGPVVHPQFWPEELDYTGKRMAVIGSGATAITIVPVAARKAAKVTMIQRSPTYVHSLTSSDPVDRTIRAWLPRDWASQVLRVKWAFVQWAFYVFTQKWPEKAKEVMLRTAKEQAPAHISWDPHFKPNYNVWDQRLCVCPDNDFYQALREGKADLKTGAIRSVERDAVVMESGERVEADVLVTATGLKLQMLGGAKMTVDGGEPIDVGDRFMWRGTMLQGVPNAMLVIGYWNNSWTLGAELATQIFLSTIQNSLTRGMTSCTPTISAEEEKDMTVRPLWRMTSTYLKTGNKTYPKASTEAPWTEKDDYLRDWWAWKRNDLFKGMVFGRAPQLLDQKREPKS